MNILCTNYGIPLYRHVWRSFAVKGKNNLIWLPFKSFEHFSKTLLILLAKLSVPARTRRVGFGCGCPHLDSTAVMNCWKFILPQGPLLLLLLFDDARRAAEDLDLFCLFIWIELKVRHRQRGNSLINWSILKGQTWHTMPCHRIGMPQCTAQTLEIRIQRREK